MSDELPSHVLEAIFKKLSVKSLLQFRSVSKAWKSLIDSSEFIVAHSVCHTQPQHLLVNYTEPQHLVNYNDGRDYYVSFFDDDCFPQNRFVPTFPLQHIRLPRIVGSSYGLLCFEGYKFPSSIYGKRTAVIFNPSIRKSVAIALPDMLYDGQNIVLGFGVCPVTLDPKIVQMTQIRWWSDMKCAIGNFWKVKVYTLSSGRFTRLSSNLPGISVYISRPQVVIDRFIYWCAADCATVDSVLIKKRNFIMSFDITNENFGVVDLPNRIAINPLSQFSISKLGESLVMLEYNEDGYNTYNEKQQSCSVWMMEHGVERSFTKLYTIKASGADLMLAVGFRKTGAPIMEVQDDMFGSTPELVVYEPNSELSNTLISGFSLNVNFYNETLVLLGRSDIMDALQKPRTYHFQGNYLHIS